MYCICLRKINRIIFSNKNTNKKQRTATCLQECMESPSDPFKKWRRRAIFILIITSGVLCYILNYKAGPTAQLLQLKSVGIKEMSMNNYNLKKITLRSSIETVVRNETEIIISNNEHIKDLKNISFNIESDFSLLIKTETPILIKTKGKLLLCTIDTKKYKPEVLMKKAKVSLGFHREYAMVSKGGYYKPADCKPRHKVGILVPYRDRETNLAVFMFTMHPFLIKQKLEYRIFIIEQAGKEPFNRGRLFNVGFKEMLRYGEWHCVVFHDVDLLPLDEKILYTCPTFPRHMCATVVEKQKLSYNNYHTFFGGVASMTIEHYRQVNGYSNMYWGWGAEDNDMFWRLRASHLPIVRYNKSVARYTSLPHPKQAVNPDRYRLLHAATERFKTDGLSNIVYKVLSIKLRHLYTHIVVDINPFKKNLSYL